MHVFNSFKRTLTVAAALTLMLGSVGCSSFGSSHFAVQDRPMVTLNTLASAETEFVAAPFSLVAADSIGLATFGQHIVADDLRAINGSFADAN